LVVIEYPIIYGLALCGEQEVLRVLLAHIEISLELSGYRPYRDFDEI
jgi:hypothetical protein